MTILPYHDNNSVLYYLKYHFNDIYCDMVSNIKITKIGYGIDAYCFRIRYNNKYNTKRNFVMLITNQEYKVKWYSKKNLIKRQEKCGNLFLLIVKPCRQINKRKTLKKYNGKELRKYFHIIEKDLENYLKNYPYLKEVIDFIYSNNYNIIYKNILIDCTVDNFLLLKKKLVLSDPLHMF